MKKYIFYILSFIILLPALSNWLVVISFKINQEEIAKTICLRKNILLNNCKGICNLKEQLKKIDDLEKNTSKFSLKKLQIEIAFFDITTFEQSPIICNTNSNFPIVDSNPNSIITPLFQPPRIV